MGTGKCHWHLNLEKSQPLVLPLVILRGYECPLVLNLLLLLSYAYLDDLIICSKNGDTHLADLEAVLLKVKEAGLKAKLTKCEFLKAKVTFLGHIVDANGIHTMDDKISAIKKFPEPRTVENIRSFIGLCGYYRPFIDGFAKIASPLTILLKKEIPFHWNATQEKSFTDLKSAFQ